MLGGVCCYTVVILLCGTTYNALLLDVSGCVALSQDLDEAKALIRDGLALHLQSMLDDGESLPVAGVAWDTEAEPWAPTADEVERYTVCVEVPPEYAYIRTLRRTNNTCLHASSD